MWKETACCQTDSLKNATSLSTSFQWGRSILRYIWSMWEFFCSFSILGRQNSNQMDCPRSYSFSKVYFCEWCLELWNRDVGGCILWRKTLLGDDQPRCKYKTSPLKIWNEIQFSESCDFYTHTHTHTHKYKCVYVYIYMCISENDRCLKKWNDFCLTSGLFCCC